ncbi:MAG TPA: hypothetical protein PK812_09285 [Beijerinckiaceae bacterium]|nr:hypothetical protein [Beijerinckiaceae bacterium]
MTFDQRSFERGARNMLVGCAGAKPGEKLLIVREEPGAGYHCDELPEALAATAGEMGLHVGVVEELFRPEATALSPELEARVRDFDHVVFLARIGDQLRFRPMPGGPSLTVNYALDGEALASAFGTAPHAALLDLKTAFNLLLHSAGKIRVTCPLGTDFSGAAPAPKGSAPADVTIRRFPMSVFAPLDASGFSGRVAIAHLLVGTGSNYYEPYGIPVAAPIIAVMEKGRLLRFEGDAEGVARAEAHYDRVSGLLGLDAHFVHSWHAGIHPGCRFTGSAHDRYERWSGSAFGNPRLLHFHTCGDYAPGEISWNVVDPTIEADGVTIWRDGRILIDNVPGAGEVLDKYQELRDLFERPERHIGL